MAENNNLNDLNKIKSALIEIDTLYRKLGKENPFTKIKLNEYIESLGGAEEAYERILNSIFT